MNKLLCSIILVAVAGFGHAEIIPPPGGVYNSDFENGMSGWGTWGSGSGTGGLSFNNAFIETTGGHGGGQFMNVQTTATDWWGYNIIWRSDQAEMLLADPLDWFTMGVWAKDLSGNGGNTVLTFEWIDWTGGGVGGDGIIPYTEFEFPVTTSWAYYEVTDQAPLGVIGLSPAWGTRSAGTEIGIDDVFVVPEPMSIALLSFGAFALRRRK